MDRAHIKQISFAWEDKPDSPFNTWFLKMILKHWTFARSVGFLSQFLISPAHDSYDKAHLLLYRWLVGCQADFKKLASNPEYYSLLAQRQKRSKWRKQVGDIQFLFASSIMFFNDWCH